MSAEAWPGGSGGKTRGGPGEAAIADIVPLLRRSGLCRGLGLEELREIAAGVRRRSCHSGDIVFRQDQPSTSLYLVAKGRIKIAVHRGDYRFHDYLGRGDHFGEMALLTEGPSFGTASAVMDTELLELEGQQFQLLLSRVPGFAANLSRSLGMRMRGATSGKRRRHQPVVVGLVNSTLRTQGLLAPLARELVTHGDTLEVLTDRAEAWPTEGAYLVERIPADLPAARRAQVVKERLAQVLEHHTRVLLDVTQSNPEGELSALLAQCEEIWWLLEPAYAETSARNLANLVEAEPGLAERIHVVWILRETDRIAPRVAGLPQVAPLDFKVVLTESPRSASWPQRRSVMRLVRHLRGARVGLTLSGGGARGMAHLGVLRALERAEIGFDLLAGTSSGALACLSYCAGWNPDDALTEFHRQLTPGRVWRALPGGRRWFMYAMFRWGAWERMLRPYLPDADLTQLQVPLSIVAVDLVTGRQIVRQGGDAIDAVLESINLPIISRPILRDGMALVDGGVLNNLPADVLSERGADLVVGVDVMARLPQEFAGNVPGLPAAQMRRPGMLETLMRLNEVQDHGVGAAHARRVDIMITPDTPRFDFSDFSRARELADVGEAAAEELIPQIKQVIADLLRG